jgi:Bacterial type III secretion apparatus protein (OrgA_MxiK)/YOP proteins translocation protein K (YscK)
VLHVETMQGPPVQDPAGSAWLAEFCWQPAAYIHPDRFHPCVPDLPRVLADQLLDTPRLRNKLSNIIIAHYRLGTCVDDLASHQVRPSLWVAERLIRLAYFAGAVWHAHSLRRLILGRWLAVALSGFDPALRETALANLDLAPEDVAPLAGIELAEAIRLDGIRCLGAWIGQLPENVRSRVVLKFSVSSAIDGATSAIHQRRGASIINRLATQVGDGAAS